jgi:choice-of-anchor B domain-containing protein
MKNFIYIFITVCLVFVNHLYSQNVDLLGQLNPYPNTAYADIWGYAADGREYALMGVTGGTSIIDVTDPANPVEVDFISGPLAPPYEWRDIKTHLNYAYVITEGTGSGQGLQIIDLSNLPTSASLVNTVDTWFSRAHNIFIDNGYAYVIGTNGGGGMHILDLSDPVNPTQTAYYTASDYIHDIYVWNDTVVACAADSYDLVDVSNKNNPQLVSLSSPIPGIYAHSGWMTEDKRYFIATEEFNVRDLMVYDLQDRSTWDLVVPTWQMSGNSPIHNIFVLGNYAHISYYKDGYVVLDISDPTAPSFAGQYDTYPSTGGTYDGAWGCYPYLPSGNVIISDMSTGLYVLDFIGDNTTTINEMNSQPIEFELMQNYPNPFNPSTNISFLIPEPGLVTLKVFNVIGEEVAELINEFKEAGNYDVNFSADNLTTGIYFAKLTAGNNIQTIKMNLLK